MRLTIFSFNYASFQPFHTWIPCTISINENNSYSEKCSNYHSILTTFEVLVAFNNLESFQLKSFQSSIPLWGISCKREFEWGFFFGDISQFKFVLLLKQQIPLLAKAPSISSSPPIRTRSYTLKSSLQSNAAGNGIRKQEFGWFNSQIWLYKHQHKGESRNTFSAARFLLAAWTWNSLTDSCKVISWIIYLAKHCFYSAETLAVPAIDVVKYKP